MSEELNTSSFSYRIIAQFSFIVDDPTLSCILKGIASSNIGIIGYMQTKAPMNSGDNDGLNLVRLTVGSPDLETAEALRGVRETLQCLKVKYQEKPVIQVVVPMSRPGIISGLYGALWCKVKVNAIYIGEGTTLFIDTADVCEALLILTEVPLKQCPLKCEPN